MITQSECIASCASSKPEASKSARMRSVSTWFFAHPSVTNRQRGCVSCAEGDWLSSADGCEEALWEASHAASCAGAMILVCEVEIASVWEEA